MIQKILLADDNPELLSTCSELLQGYGFKVCTAGNFAELEKAFVTETPDLLICDIMFGDHETGPDFYKRITESGRMPKVPVVYVSGLVDSRTERPFVNESEVAMYSKPFNIEKLVADIRAVSSSVHSARAA